MRGILLVIFCIFVSCFGLSCFYCDRNSCPGLVREKCAHGVVKDICGCCDVCAQGEGEVCGGIYYDHTCSAGTKCMIELEFGLPYHTYIQMNGTCKSEEPGISQFSACFQPLAFFIISFRHAKGSPWKAMQTSLQRWFLQNWEKQHLFCQQVCPTAKHECHDINIALSFISCISYDKLLSACKPGVKCITTLHDWAI